jgi:hypothetical protein
MPRSLRHPVGRQSILNRLAALTPEHPRRWGRMEPAQLLPHLATALRMALGERRLEGTPPGRIRGALLRYLAIYCLPWPKGRIQASADAFSTPSAGFEQDRRIVVELIERFATVPPERMGADHPFFGPMSARDWDVLQYRHLDHHLRQFGV